MNKKQGILNIEYKSDYDLILELLIVLHNLKITIIDKVEYWTNYWLASNNEQGIMNFEF
jgi:hypothetical protein